MLQSEAYLDQMKTSRADVCEMNAGSSSTISIPSAVVVPAGKLEQGRKIQRKDTEVSSFCLFSMQK